MGLWAPLNILVSMAWGALLFGELFDLPRPRWLPFGAAMAALIGGILLIIAATPRPADTDRPAAANALRLGTLAAVAAGLGWGSYFIPLQLVEASAWVTALPLAVGMALGGALLVLIKPVPLRPTARPSRLALLAGVGWAVGNYGSLQLMERLGTGRGFAIAQACVVVNALVGIYCFREPRPGTRAARQTLLGVVLAAAGAAGVGLIR
jgi:glucose uptake protein